MSATMSATRRTNRETKEEARLRAQREWLAAEPERKRQEERVTRSIHTKLLFWTVCPYKPCRRAKACRGDIEICGDRCYPQIPPDVRHVLAAMAEAVRAGATPEQVDAAANAAWQRTLEFAEREKAWEAMHSAAGAPPKPEPSQPLRPGRHP